MPRSWTQVVRRQATRFLPWRHGQFYAVGVRHLVAILAVSLFTVPAVVLAAPIVDVPVAQSSQAAESAFVKVKIEHKGNSVEHPGYRIEHGVEETYAISEGGRNHEVTVMVRGGEGSSFDVHVIYSLNGKQHGETDLKLRPGKYTSFKAKGTKVSVYLDPQGDVDKSRKDKIDKPKGDDPLG